MSAHANAAGLAEAAAEFPNARIAQSNGPDGAEKLIELATLPEADLVLIAIVGTAGLAPALAAIEAGKDIAVASKEILVLAGEIVMAARATQRRPRPPRRQRAQRDFPMPRGARSRACAPAHSHLLGRPLSPDAGHRTRHRHATMALRHPTWTMGRKITIDSATLFNKALEMIEARWLFDVGMDRIDVVIHPQSIVHSLVEFVDGSQLAQLSRSDMCFPIQYAVTWPDRVAGSLTPLDLATVGRLEFEAPREDVFPALRLAREAGTTCGTLPAVLNAANEIAVEAFLAGRIPFPRIWEIVEAAMRAHSVVAHPDLAQLLAADAWARKEAKALCEASFCSGGL